MEGKPSSKVVDTPSAPDHENNNHVRGLSCVDKLRQRRTDGVWAWLLAITSFCSLLIIEGLAFTYGVIYPDLMNAFPGKRVLLAFGGSLIHGMYFMTAPLGSTFVERFGSVKSLIVGSCLLATGFVSSSFTKSADFFIVTYSVLTGLGCCLVYTSVVLATTQYFDKWRSFALGLIHCGSGLGTFLSPFLARSLVASFGWRNCIRIEAGLVSFVFMTSFLYKTPPLASNREEHSSLTSALKRVCNIELLTDRRFILMIVSGGISSIGIFFATNFLMDIALDKGLSLESATWVVSVFGLTNMLGRLLAGLAANKLPVHPLLILAVVEAVSVAAMFAENKLQTVALLSVYSTLIGLLFAFVASYVPIVAVRVMGLRNIAGSVGFILFGRGIVALLSVPLVGFIRSLTGKYSAPSYLAGAVTVTAVLLNVVTWKLDRAHKKRVTPGDENCQGVETVKEDRHMNDRKTEEDDQ